LNKNKKQGEIFFADGKLKRRLPIEIVIEETEKKEKPKKETKNNTEQGWVIFGAALAIPYALGGLIIFLIMGFTLYSIKEAEVISNTISIFLKQGSAGMWLVGYFILSIPAILYMIVSILKQILGKAGHKNNAL